MFNGGLETGKGRCAGGFGEDRAEAGQGQDGPEDGVVVNEEEGAAALPDSPERFGGVARFVDADRVGGGRGGDRFRNLEAVAPGVVNGGAGGGLDAEDPRHAFDPAERVQFPEALVYAADD